VLLVYRKPHSLRRWLFKRSDSLQVDNQFLLLGTYAGDIKWYNVNTGVEESSLLCHSSALTAIEQSKVSPLTAFGVNTRADAPYLSGRPAAAHFVSFRQALLGVVGDWRKPRTQVHFERVLLYIANYVTLQV